ncbi:cystatin-1 [Tetranychus urticae]|uniref:Cystatin domain-containing protein n=1 Tax=Tetranychus urticae TaxID=32264 RepID=T1K6M9_TETUR|nr:cystatin-1 [Tetranychus urticae]
MKFILFAVCLIGAVFAIEMDGGWSSISVDHPTVIQLAAKGVEHHNKIANNLYYKKLITIKEAKSQVVAGMNYEVKFLIGKTECVKSDANAASCEVSANAIPELCTYVFWVRPGSDNAQITQASCAPAK